MEPVNILIVDDEEANLLVLEQALKTENCQPIKAGSGREALECSNRDDFVLMILDIQMPGMNGFELATEMRNREKTKHIPIIFVTAIHTDEEYIFRGYQSGAVDYLSKPVKLNILRSKVNVFIELYQQKKRVEVANAELIKTNEELQQANQDLKLVQSQLIQAAKMTLLGELEASAIHELTQPLFSITLHAENLLTHLEKKSFTKLHTGLEDIINQVDRASSILDHMRSFGREASDLEYKPENLNKIIEDSLMLVNKKLNLNEVHIIKELLESLPAIECNAIQIEQVISNLLVNANDAVVDCSPKEIKIQTFAKNSVVVLDIQDTGNGIATHHLEQIFHPFFTTKETGKGMGLGLSISNHIIKEHGGHIHVVSEHTQGTTFSIELPIQKKSTMATKALEDIIIS